jgi:hypothetical protein
VAGEWWGNQVLDIADLHDKELEFEVLVYHLKLRELSKAVRYIRHVPLPIRVYFSLINLKKKMFFNLLDMIDRLLLGDYH